VATAGSPASNTNILGQPLVWEKCQNRRICYMRTMLVPATAVRCSFAS
jgi:hypothetical protein